MATELAGALQKRRSNAESGQVWESKPEPSSADASHFEGISFGNAPSAKEWMATVEDMPEEDPVAEALDELVKSRNEAPEHAPRERGAEDEKRIQAATEALAELQKKLTAESASLGSQQEELARRREEITAREKAIATEVEKQRSREEARKNYPQPSWLDNVEDTLNLAVVGNSGVGKSLLINTFRKTKRGNEKWAPVGVNETTMRPTQYAFPGNNGIRLWDLPGAGTAGFPLETYIQTMGLRYFDSVLIVTAGRFTTTEIALRTELEEHRVPYFMVRTKIDLDVWNNSEDNGLAEEATLKQIRDDLRSNHSVESPYLVSSRYPKLYDLPKLKCDAFPGLQNVMDANAPSFAPGENGGWGDAWALPNALSPALSGIQGQWTDSGYSNTFYHIEGTQAHVTLHDGRTAIVGLVETDDKVIWCNRWHVTIESVDRARKSCELRWTPTDLKDKPLVWRWIS